MCTNLLVRRIGAKKGRRSKQATFSYNSTYQLLYIVVHWLILPSSMRKAMQIKYKRKLVSNPFITVLFPVIFSFLETVAGFEPLIL